MRGIDDVRPHLIRLLAIATIVIVAACACELFVRVAGGKPVTFLYSASFRDRQTDWDVTYGVTRENLRATCAQAQDARRKFAVIGDSFVFGQGVPDCLDFVSRLGAQVPDAQFVNFGIIGVGIETYRLVARDLLGPDFTDVVVLFYGNDISEIVERRSLFGALADSLSTFALIRRVKRSLAVQAFVEKAPTAADTGSSGGTFNNIRSIVSSDRDYFSNVADPGERKLRLFREQLSLLVAKLATDVPRERIWIAAVPEAATVSGQVRDFVQSLGGTLPPFGAPGSGYEAIKALSRQERVRFIDLFPAFLAGGSAGYFSHDLHWSPEGHRLAAQLIGEAIIGAQGGQH
jgi:GDSL-like Lipase/Acylhydrolase family